MAADISLQRRQEGRLLLGGAPLRFMRLSEAGARQLRAWLDGGVAVAASPGSQKLARRLVSAGMVHPLLPPVVPGPARPPDSALASDSELASIPESAAEPSAAASSVLTVVIPVKDDQSGLDLTLRGVGRWPVVVVDDGSARPLRLPARTADQAESTTTDPTGGDRPRVRLVRRPRCGGPGAARQSSLDLVVTPLVAFVDAGVEITDDDLASLVRWFADATVVAVGPRVAATAGSDRLSAYERRHSPLDLGPHSATVGPGRRVAYLPSAVLVARTDAVRAVGGFDPGLRYGEDVDLVWRLLDHGMIRYDPTVVAHHPARGTVAGLIRQRAGYGSSAAPLARRHGSDLAPVRLSGWSLACWVLALLGQPMAAVGLAATTAVALRRKLMPMLGDGWREPVSLTFRGHWSAGGSLADASLREWWPITVAAYGLGLRRPVRLLVALAAWRRLRSAPPGWSDRAGELTLGLIDDGAYGLGVWQGCWRQRSVRCLLPRLTSWPGRSTTADARPATGR